MTSFSFFPVSCPACGLLQSLQSLYRCWCFSCLALHAVPALATSELLCSEGKAAVPQFKEHLDGDSTNTTQKFRHRQAFSLQAFLCRSPPASFFQVFAMPPVPAVSLCVQCHQSQQCPCWRHLQKAGALQYRAEKRGRGHPAL